MRAGSPRFGPWGGALVASWLLVAACDGDSEGSKGSTVDTGAADADGDGAVAASAGGTDCDDADPTVHPGATEDCGDGTDQDCDGLTDCADPDCSGDAACVEDCGNGADDDADGLVDCADPDCQPDRSCPEDCGNGADDDADGLVDCEDGDCAADAACQEDCGNGVDDDADGRVDCEDGDCVDDAACAEDCGNGVDDDADGLVDCDDEECTWAAGCVPETTMQVRVAEGGGYWYGVTSPAGAATSMYCAVRVWFDSGTVSSTAGGVTCTFTGGLMRWGMAGWSACSVGHFELNRSTWDEVPSLSPSCALALSPWAAPPQEMYGPQLFREEVGHRGNLRMIRTDTPAWSVRATLEVTYTYEDNAGSMRTYRYFTFVSSFTWVWSVP